MNVFFPDAGGLGEGKNNFRLPDPISATVSRVLPNSPLRFYYSHWPVRLVLPLSILSCHQRFKASSNPPTSSALHLLSPICNIDVYDGRLNFTFGIRRLEIGRRRFRVPLDGLQTGKLWLVCRLCYPNAHILTIQDSNHLYWFHLKNLKYRQTALMIYSGSNRTHTGEYMCLSVAFVCPNFFIPSPLTLANIARGHPPLPVARPTRY